MATPGSSEAEPGLSLLWPPGSSHDPAWQLPREVIQDLGLATLVAAMAPAPAHREALEAVLFTFCPHPTVIAYRQDVLDDLLATPGLAEALGALLPALDELALFTTRPVAQELRQHAAHSGRALVELRPGVIYFSYAVALVKRMTATGLPLCRPAIAPLDERICEVEALYNLQLALQLEGQGPDDLTGRVVTSNSILGPRGRIVILTGPNQGGKTTYLQAIGQAHVLAQAGLRVPGRQARISPADAIFTHFPLEERLERGTGRFGDEARRVRAIFGGSARGQSAPGAAPERARSRPWPPP
jgi:MutS domain V